MQSGKTFPIAIKLNPKYVLFNSVIIAQNYKKSINNPDKKNIQTNEPTIQYNCK